MQENLVVLNLWLERKYKGYKYLNKWNRSRLYANTQKIIELFRSYCDSVKVDMAALQKEISALGVDLVGERAEKIKYLYLITEFLRPGKYYQYLEGASFGKLLSDPEKKKLIGDCNQIVTFYAFLYSLRFPISDLKIKLMPKHVCLHYEGVDIEATNGTFTRYSEYDHLLPIVELLTTNLLDVSDFRDKTLQIDTRILVSAAELAFRLSSMRDVVRDNLKITYHNLVVDAMNQNDFDTAVFFVRKTDDLKLKEAVYTNAVVFYTKENNFDKARYYLQNVLDPKLKEYVLGNEGYFYFKKGDFDKALQVYRTVGDNQMIKACYAEQFNRLQKKVSAANTVEAARYYRSDYEKMKDLAGRMGDSNLVQQMDKIIKSLG